MSHFGLKMGVEFENITLLEKYVKIFVIYGLKRREILGGLKTGILKGKQFSLG